jgi:serine-type D-Ala-D-Ala carboxypeptidase/endopeptidase (penicillin-binding protein 4)
VAVATLTVVVLVLTLLGRLPGQGSDASAGGPSKSSQGPTTTPSGTPAAEPVLPPVGATAPLPTPAGLARVLAPLLADPSLGRGVGAVVADLSTQRLLWGRDAAAGHTPASTTKLLTAAAALSRLGPGFRMSTTVVAGSAADQVVLVGGGDPTLATGPAPGFVPAPASLPDLAAQTATRLRAAGTTRVRLGYDASLFTGPAVAPTWPPAYVTSGVVSPVTALAVDEGRVGPIAEGTAPRVADPARNAALAFARQLARHGVTVVGAPSPTHAPAPASGTPSPTTSGTATASGTASATATAGAAPATPGTVLGQVQSPPLADLVGWMLTTSDNDLAESVAHLVGRAAGQPASFAGGVAAVTDTLADLGLPVDGLRLYDGSGLSTQTSAAPSLLAQVLGLAASTAHPELRPIVTGLAVAGFTGSLEPPRFDEPGTGRASGFVRGKTGTLTGVSAFAGSVEDVDGRVLAFVFLADHVPVGGTLAARDALDRLAAAVASCGCRA